MPQEEHRSREQRPSWSVTHVTGQWSFPKPLFSICRQWVTCFYFFNVLLFNLVPFNHLCFVQECSRWRTRIIAGLMKSLLFAVPLPQVVPLANLIVKDSLTEDDVLTCQKTVYNLVDMERKNDPLPISTVGSRGKGPKRWWPQPSCLLMFFICRSF